MQEETPKIGGEGMKRLRICKVLMLLVLIFAFILLPAPAFALSKEYRDLCTFNFFYPVQGVYQPVAVVTSRIGGFNYYYNGSGYYCTCIVYWHEHGGFFKNISTWPDGFLVDCTGRNRYYANGSFVAEVQIPDNWYGRVWIPIGEEVWGGDIDQDINLWPAYNDSCNAVTEAFSNAMPWYISNTALIGF